MISLKKYLDMGTPILCSPAPDLSELLVTVLECYTAALLAVGKSGAQACPVAGSDLQQRLATLGKSASAATTALQVKETETQVEEQLQQWGDRSAEYFKTKAGEVKELLMVLAQTTESMGERDQRYAGGFTQLQNQLQSIAHLDDLAQVRSSLLQRAGELKNQVDQMTRESKKTVTQLQAAVSTYETKLKAAEELALKDPLTGLANRRNLEERIASRLAQKQPFCVAIFDLNGFKKINDTHGHLAGDNLLKQFGQELRSNVRGTDAIGRWGGDEFMLVMDCDLIAAQSRIESLQKWAFGDYTVPLGAGKSDIKVKVEASVGIASWRAGQSMQQVIENADAAMYKQKGPSRKQ